ncbi:hypothetical protein [Neotabrizicola sp. sgz301269]|uniref:hypothetical protein n=1 Tax=Neotabrizicola sp. sgz301269 TaxID=3276282 RepID=UPI0037702F3C
MMKMSNEAFSEERIRNAYRGAPLLVEDIIEMQRRIISENKDWKRRKNKIENIGEVLDVIQIERGRKSAERHRRKVKVRQDIGWGASIPAELAIWD